MTGALWSVAIAVVALLGAIILYLLAKGVGVLSWQFVTQANVQSTFDGPEVFNTFYIIALALLICIPFSLSAAIYLVEYARQGRFTRLTRFATETLAGVPSIILGLFGFLIFVTNFGLGTRLGYSRLAGALTLVILNLPGAAERLRGCSAQGADGTARSERGPGREQTANGFARAGSNSIPFADYRCHPDSGQNRSARRRR